MTTRTRYFMLGSFAVLIAGLCTGLVAYYGGFPTGLLAQAGPNELSYVPANATVVAFADVQDVMSSELRRQLKQVLPSDETKGQQELKERTGIDLERDIDHVVAAMLPAEGDKASGDGFRGTGFVAFRGRFDAVRLESLAREHQAEVVEYKGRRLIQLPREKAAQHHGRVPVLAFAEPGLVMFGDEQAVRLAIDTAEGGSSVTSNSELMSIVKDVAGDSNAWAVGRFDVLANQAKLPEGVSSKLPALRWFAASGRVNGGISATLRAEARDEQAAQNLRDMVNGVLALARMQTESRKDLQGIMQTVHMSGTGNTVELSFSLPTEVINTAIAAGQRAKQHHDGQRGMD
jgi:hypothetical protein